MHKCSTGMEIKELKGMLSQNRLKTLSFVKTKKTQEDNARDDMDNLNLKNQFDPRKPQDSQLTNERISSLINGIIQNIPSACVLFSIEHTKDDGLPELLPQKALSFMSSE